jgi:hypothetical protein
MNEWWRSRDREAIERLIRLGAQRSDTRSLINVVGDYGEYLAWKEFGGVRCGKAHSLPDLQPTGWRHGVEAKARQHPTRGWNLGKFWLRAYYCLIRLDADWSVTEAFLVPLAVAKRHATDDLRHYLPARGDWMRERRVERLDRLNRF